MRLTRVFPLVAAAAVLAACGGDSNGPSNQKPTADFTPPSCTVNAACDFAGTGTDADGSVTGYSWDFGDQSPALSGQNVSHTYTTAGTYQVTLTVTDNGGATGTVTKAVTVAGGPTANFTVQCNGLDCSFTDTSVPTTGLTYAWDFGDPTSGANNNSTAQNPTHTYSAATVTNYTVSLTVTDANGQTSNKTQTITVTPPAGLQCGTGTGDLVNCTLDVSQKAKLTITLTNRDCQFTGNRFAITAPIQQTIFTNGCSEPIGTVYTVNGPNGDGSFNAGTQIQAQFTQGVGKPTDPARGNPALRVTGSYPTWEIDIDDGGNPTGPGEPDFNDIVLTVQATAVP